VALIVPLAHLMWVDLAQACFLKLAGPQLVQMFIGDGAKLVRDAFALAKEKSKPGSSRSAHKPAVLMMLMSVKLCRVRKQWRHHFY
jgi:hypothetical protein